jgi:hypothetical protein
MAGIRYYQGHTPSGLPPVFHRSDPWPVPVPPAMGLGGPPEHRAASCVRGGVWATTACGAGSFRPVTRGRPRVVRMLGGGGSSQAASAIALADRRQAAVGRVAKSGRLAGAIPGIPHHEALPLREPAEAASAQEPGNMGRCLGARLMGLLPCWGTIPGHPTGSPEPTPTCGPFGRRCRGASTGHHHDGGPCHTPSAPGARRRYQPPPGRPSLAGRHNSVSKIRIMLIWSMASLLLVNTSTSRL